MSAQQTTLDRLPPLPCNDEAERYVISALVNDSSRLDRVKGSLPEDAFHGPNNRLLYEGLVDMSERGMDIDSLSFTAHLEEMGKLARVGGPGVVSELLTAAFPSESGFAYHVGLLKQLMIVRRQMVAAAAMLDDGYSYSGIQTSVEDYVRACEARQFEVTADLQDVSAKVSKRDWQSQGDVVDRALSQVEAVIRTQGSIQPERVATGFTDLDRMTGGDKPGDMIVIAARPAMGKTSFASNIAHNASLGREAMHYFRDMKGDGTLHVQPKNGAFISIEMPADDIEVRELAGGSSLDLTALRSGMGLRNGQKDLIQEHYQRLLRCKLDWLDVPELTIQELRSKLRQLKTRLIQQGEDLHFAVVDYLQLMKSSTSKAKASREIEVAEISSGIKAAAKELGIPIYVLCQLNRKAEDRPNGEPELSDLRESGAIEQDADKVILLWRPHYYNEEADENMAILKLAKHRGGPVGSVLLHWDSARTQFTSTCNYLHSNHPDHRQKPIPPIPRKGSGKKKGDDASEAEAPAAQGWRPAAPTHERRGRGRPPKQRTQETLPMPPDWGIQDD